MVSLCFNSICGIDRAPNFFVYVETSTCPGINWRLLVMPTCCRLSDNM
jgi:hypothetical protein